MKPLTQKQENFAQLYVELGNASEAYRRAYDTRANYNSVNVKACNLLAQDNVTVRVSQIRDSHRERHNVTVDDLLKELEEARQLAMSIDAPAPAVSATMGKAKILGLDKQIIEHSGRIDSTVSVEEYKAAERAILSALEDDDA